MKKFKMTKKLLSLVLCLLMVFTTVSVAAAETQVVKPAACQNGQHVFGGYVGTSEAATCVKEGRETYKCSVCKENYEMIIPKTGHNYDDDAWVTIVEAQHTNLAVIQGVRRNFCLDCNEMQLEYINIPHEFAENDSGEITKKATCVSDGATLKKCLLCNKKQTVIVPKNDDGHVYSDVYFTDKAPTCTKPGSGVKVCKYCDKVESVINVYAKNKEEAHSYLPWVFVEGLDDDATCNDGTYGYYVKNCPDCKETIVQNFYAHHDIVNPVGVDSNCTNFGYAVGTGKSCKNCTTENPRNVIVIDSNKHVWKEDIVVKEANCQEKGTILRICELNRAHAQLVDIEAGEHKFAGDWTVTKAATCSEPGIKENTCTVCNEVITEEIPVDESLHEFDEANAVKHLDNTLSCKTLVKETSKCTKCGKDMEREILNHNFEYKGKVDPTCSATGKLFYECIKCAANEIVITPIDPELHVGSGYYYVITESTCTTEGVEAELCKKCNKAILTNTKPVAKKGHVASEWKVGVQNTCTTAGTKVRHCTNKDCSFSITMNIAASHRYSAWSYASPGKDAAKCNEYVTRIRFCLVEGCNDSQTEKYYGSHIPGTYKFVSGNCKDGGYVVVNCSHCGKNYKTYNLPAGVHMLDTEHPVGAIEADDLICGGMIYNCLVCTDEATGEPLQLRLTNPHSYRTIETTIKPSNPTCTTAGMTSKKACFDCGLVVEQTEIEATGHNFVWGSKGEVYCSKCGEYAVENEYVDLIYNCKHFCHNKGMMAKILVKILSKFWQIFGMNHFCADCANPHYHEDSTVIHSVTKNEKGKLVIVYSCEECKVTKKEMTLK